MSSPQRDEVVEDPFDITNVETFDILNPYDIDWYNPSQFSGGEVPIPAASQEGADTGPIDSNTPKSYLDEPSTPVNFGLTDLLNCELSEVPEEDLEFVLQYRRSFGDDAAETPEYMNQQPEGVTSRDGQMAPDEQAIVDESITVEDIYDPEEPLVITPPLTRAQKVDIGVFAADIGLKMPSTYLPEGLQWAPRIQYVAVPKERDGDSEVLEDLREVRQAQNVGNQPTSTRKRNFSEVDEGMEPSSKRRHLDVPQMNRAQAPMSEVSTRQKVGLASLSSGRKDPTRAQSEQMGQDLGRMHGAVGSEYPQPTYQASTQSFETAQALDPAPTSEYELGFLAELVSFNAGFDSNAFPDHSEWNGIEASNGADDADFDSNAFLDHSEWNGTEPRSGAGYDFGAAADTRNVFSGFHDDGYNPGFSRGPMITPSPLFSDEGIRTSRKRKADDSEDLNPAKKTKINLLPAEQRKSYFPGYPAAMEPLPSGISDDDIIKRYPNHLYGPLILRLTDRGFTQKKMCEMIYGPPNSPGTQDRQKKVINTLLNRIKAEMEIQGIDPKVSMKGSKKKSEEARANRRRCDAERKANGTNIANRRKVIAQAGNNQPIMAQQPAFQPIAPPTLSNPTIDPHLSYSVPPSSQHSLPRLPPSSAGTTRPFNSGSVPMQNGIAPSQQRIDDGSVGFIEPRNHGSISLGHEPGSLGSEPFVAPTYENTLAGSGNPIMTEIMAIFDSDCVPETATREGPRQPKTFTEAYGNTYLQVQEDALRADPTLLLSQKDLRAMSRNRRH
ncbi:MAG: hypothetical protein M1812_007094 [Candelaria pacifica]|nr:MAG: hypothetical protein M1812_007094 [Candelaria pacifica]